MSFEIKLQQLQQEFAVPARHRKPNGADVEERLFVAGVVPFERQGV